MTTNIVNQVAFLRTTREFPEELHQLTVEVNKSYVDIANAVNNRTISIFPTNRPAINGESWFLTANTRSQAFRQVYKITSFAAFNHGIDFRSVLSFSKITGIGFDGASYYPIPFSNPVTPTGQVGIAVNSTQVVFFTGVGSPVLVSGIIVLEWISKNLNLSIN